MKAAKKGGKLLYYPAFCSPYSGIFIIVLSRTGDDIFTTNKHIV